MPYIIFMPCRFDYYGESEFGNTCGVGSKSPSTPRLTNKRKSPMLNRVEIAVLHRKRICYPDLGTLSNEKAIL